MYSVPSSTVTTGPLEPRDSPRTWLRIVYGVFIDQRWYWQHVHPRLLRGSRPWPLFAQALAGALIVMALLLLPPALIVLLSEPGRLALAEGEGRWLIPQLLIPLGLFLLVGVVRKPAEGLPLMVGLIVGYGLCLCLYFTLQYLALVLLPFEPDPDMLGHFGPPDPDTLSFDLLILILYMAAWPLAQGLATVISAGTLAWGRWNLERGPLAGPAVRLLLGLTWLSAVALIAASTALTQWMRYTDSYDWLRQVGGAGVLWIMLPGFLLGASLAMRQVPDREERVRLARPDEA